MCGKNMTLALPLVNSTPTLIVVTISRKKKRKPAKKSREHNFEDASPDNMEMREMFGPGPPQAQYRHRTQPPPALKNVSIDYFTVFTALFSFIYRKDILLVNMVS